MGTKELQRLMYLDAAMGAEDHLPLCVARGLRYVPERRTFDNAKNAMRKRREMASVERWVDMLGHPDHWQRARACVEMLQFGRDSLAQHGMAIAAALGDADPGVRLGALKVVQLYIDKTDVMALQHGDHYRTLVVDAVLEKLQLFLGEGAVARIAQRKGEPPASAELRAEALRTVCALEPHLRKVFRDPALRLVEDEAPFVRLAAIDAVTKIGAQHGRTAPSRLAERNKRLLAQRMSEQVEPHAGVRLHVMGVLRAMPQRVQTSCAKRYVERLGDPSLRVRVAAAQAVQLLDSTGLARAEAPLCVLATADADARGRHGKPAASATARAAAKSALRRAAAAGALSEEGALVAARPSGLGLQQQHRRRRRRKKMANSEKDVSFAE